MEQTKQECRMCGKCCSYEIPLTLLDIHRIAVLLDEDPCAIFEAHVQKDISKTSGLFMIRKKDNKECLFLKDDTTCGVHAVKPMACRFYVCTLDNENPVMAWTARCTEEVDRNALWEQSVASTLTKAYIEKNGANWNETDYRKAVESILQHIVMKPTQKLKLSKNHEGTPLAMLYDCASCAQRGACAKETPITLDDVRWISLELGMNYKTFFHTKIALSASTTTGCLQLVRRPHCIFFDPRKHCTIESVRPLHCRFTPCPLRTVDSDLKDRLYLGSGTVEEQFRHQVALSVTRDYVAEWGTQFQKQAFKKALKRIDRLLSDRDSFQDFCERLTPFRYVEDIPSRFSRRDHADTPRHS
jgi:Fe-S-cluster containining protein